MVPSESATGVQSWTILVNTGWHVSEKSVSTTTDNSTTTGAISKRDNVTSSMVVYQQLVVISWAQVDSSSREMNEVKPIGVILVRFPGHVTMYTPNPCLQHTSSKFVFTLLQIMTVKTMDLSNGGHWLVNDIQWLPDGYQSLDND